MRAPGQEEDAGTFMEQEISLGNRAITNSNELSRLIQQLSPSGHLVVKHIQITRENEFSGVSFISCSQIPGNISPGLEYQWVVADQD